MFRKVIVASVAALGLIGPSGAIAHEETVFDTLFGLESSRGVVSAPAMRHKERRTERLREAAQDHPRMPYSDLHLYD